MSALLNLVTSICVTAPGNYNEACAKVIDAGATQSGVRKDLDNVESRSVGSLKIFSDKEFGQDGTDLFVGTAFIANAAASHRFVLDIPNLGLCNELRTEYDQTVYKITAEWRF